MPKYGEYAAAQAAPDQEAPLPPTYAAQPQQPYGQPTYAPHPYGQQPYGQQPYGSQYGAAPYGSPQYGAVPYGAMPYGGKRPVRTADAIVSIVLLVIGLIGVAIATLTATAGGLDSYMQGGYDEAGLGTYVPTAAQTVTQVFIIVSHVILYAISALVTILLIVKRKISFWVPLTAGVLATIAFWAALLVFMYTDPAMGESIMNPPSQF